MTMTIEIINHNELAAYHRLCVAGHGDPVGATLPDGDDYHVVLFEAVDMHPMQVHVDKRGSRYVVIDHGTALTRRPVYAVPTLTVEHDALAHDIAALAGDRARRRHHVGCPCAVRAGEEAAHDWYIHALQLPLALATTVHDQLERSR